jgi:predicted Rossmann fold nucleotide-binding protein DprA/Smf involved in DNA uptake
MNLLPDSFVLLLLCSRLGLPQKNEDEDSPAPLTLKDWNPLARKLQSENLRPGNLLGMGAAALQERLSLSEAEALRIGRLLERTTALTNSLERLERLGIESITRADPHYPRKYRQRLKETSPAVLFAAGNQDLLGQPGIAVVGSRHLDEAGQGCASFVGNACGVSGLVLYSGGAKGVDSLSMTAALDSRGTAVGILADSLERAVRKSEYQPALDRGDLCLVTPYTPNAGFSVGAAMGRNRLIYSLADYAIVVASDLETGGTWAGAVEAQKNGWVPVFVLEHPDMPEGNRQLMGKGAVGFPYPFQEHPTRLEEWLKSHAAETKSKPTQLGFF